MEPLMHLIEVLTPVLVALVSVSGGVMVAKINKIDKKLRTNHGSVSIGDAIDRLTENQNILIEKVTNMDQNDSSLDTRVGHLERHISSRTQRLLRRRRGK